MTPTPIRGGSDGEVTAAPPGRNVTPQAVNPMSWPLSQDNNEAIQNPEITFLRNRSWGAGDRSSVFRQSRSLKIHLENTPLFKIVLAVEYGLCKAVIISRCESVPYKNES